MFSSTEKLSIYSKYLHSRSHKLPKFILHFNFIAWIMPSGFVRTNWQSLNAKYIDCDCEIQISCHCYKSALEWSAKDPWQMHFTKAVQTIWQNFVSLRFKQCLQHPLEVSTGQCLPVMCPSETLSERELNTLTSIFANSTQHKSEVVVWCDDFPLQFSRCEHCVTSMRNHNK